MQRRTILGNSRKSDRGTILVAALLFFSVFLTNLYKNSCLFVGTPHEGATADLLRLENVLQRANTTAPTATSTARPNHHNRTLSHVVIPFHEKQVDGLRANLQSWETYPPCSNPLLATGKVARPTLVFHIAYSVEDDQPSDIEEVEQQCMQAFESLSQSVKSCFATAYTVPMQLYHAEDSPDPSALHASQATHSTGARLAFEAFLQGKVTSANNETSSYALYMEPDMVPIRENWLVHVITQVEWPIPEFWIKGSIFRGSEIYLVMQPYKPGMMHLNGNALYNLGSEEFRKFYFHRVRPYVVKKHYGDSINAYDTDFYEYLDDPKKYDKVREVLHYFQYTDMIQNHWHSPWSAKQLTAQFPNAVLVHGGINMDNDSAVDLKDAFRRWGMGPNV